MMKRLYLVLSIIVSLTVLASFGMAVDNIYGRKSVVQQLKHDFEYHKLTVQTNAIQERIWLLETRYPDISKMPKSVAEEYHRLKALLEINLKKLGMK